MRVHSATGRYRLLHVAAGGTGAPGQKIAGRVGVQAEVLMRLVGGVFIELRIEPAIVMHGVELDE